eukprot:TRINITY_DN1650_c0_g3_i1.p1 TRINITY_DN1650_c0_g3~~TRINITY_DN1650_c0_g3_i1.p1  ORF type:complete len:294 (-),score=77.69 TRINITY_DN1650_c0_g3_i1:156-1037(-)
MDPENDSFSKMDESLKRERIFEKLFDDLENVGVGSSPFEKLPKLILSHILQFLNAKDLAPIFRLNKFFFKFLWISPNSGLLWGKLCINQQEGEKVEESDVEQYVMNPTIDKFEKKMNRYLLYFKHSNLFEWDPKYKEDVFEIHNKRKVVYERRSQKQGTINTWSIASKNVFKSNHKKVELICSFYAQHPTCTTFGLITSSYSSWNTYTYYSNGGRSGVGEGTIATEVGEGPVYEINILIDIEEKTMTSTNLQTNKKAVLSMSRLVNVENGLRFAVSLTEVGDYFEVKKMRTFS